MNVTINISHWSQYLMIFWLQKLINIIHMALKINFDR